MQQTPEIVVIPARKEVVFSPVTGIGIKKKVAAYARVSTETEEQANSYQAQVEYYTEKIKNNIAWDFVGVYTDEGISGTDTKHREGFKKMIADALEGKIDMILTKSCSRFARNTVTTLTTVRQLKEKNIDVFFEKEQIHSTDAKGELMLTIMSSLAQDESRNISENVKWGHRQRFSKGQVYMTYKAFLGYKKGAEGKPVIVEEEAKVIRLIYKLFLNGLPISKIARKLEEQGIKTPKGKEKWSTSSIKSILTNEKYKGDCLLQKTYSADFITKKVCRNKGELPQYYVKDSHPAIIARDVFDKVQVLIKRMGRGTSAKSFMSGKLICRSCGGIYGSKIWHSNDKFRKVVWQCNRKYKKRGTQCKSPTITEEMVKTAFLEWAHEEYGLEVETFSEELWYKLVDKIYVEVNGELSFLERDGARAG